MALYMLFGVLWMTAFLEYCSTFILLCSAASYYFNSDANNEGSADVGYAFHAAFMCHSGSIAIGSFVIAVIRFIRICFLYAAK